MAPSAPRGVDPVIETSLTRFTSSRGPFDHDSRGPRPRHLRTRPPEPWAWCLRKVTSVRWAGRDSWRAPVPVRSPRTALPDEAEVWATLIASITYDRFWTGVIGSWSAVSRWSAGLSVCRTRPHTRAGR